MNNLISEQQVNVIVEAINTRLDAAKDKIQAMAELCDKEYLHGREQYPITAIVYTAFNAEEQNIPGLRIQKVQYGNKKLWLPVLSNNKVYIEVFGDTAKPWAINEVKTKYELKGDRFRLLIFSIDREIYKLRSLQLLSFDGFDSKGNVHINKRETVYRAL